MSALAATLDVSAVPAHPAGAGRYTIEVAQALARRGSNGLQLVAARGRQAGVLQAFDELERRQRRGRSRLEDDGVAVGVPLLVRVDVSVAVGVSLSESVPLGDADSDAVSVLDADWLPSIGTGTSS